MNLAKYNDYKDKGLITFTKQGTDYVAAVTKYVDELGTQETELIPLTLANINAQKDILIAAIAQLDALIVDLNAIK